MFLFKARALGCNRREQKGGCSKGAKGPAEVTDGEGRGVVVRRASINRV